MTARDKIEQFKIQLENTTGEKQQAEILIDMLEQHAVINSSTTKHYIDQLLQLAEKLNEGLYKAWGNYYLATYKRLKGEYDAAKDYVQQALVLFAKINFTYGIAKSFNSTGNIFYMQGNYTEALNIHFA